MANYSAGNSKIIYKAQRSGGAVAGDWSYDDATTDMSLGTSTAHSFSLKTGNTRALTLDTSQNATFAGDVGLGGTGLYTASHSLNIDGTGLAIKNDTNGSSNNWSAIKNTDTGSNSNLVFNSGLGTALTLNHNKSATFAGDVSVTGANLNFLASDAAQIKAKESMIFTIDSDNNQTSRVFQFKEGSVRIF